MANAENRGAQGEAGASKRSPDYRERRRDNDARGLAYGVAAIVSVEPVSTNGVRAERISTREGGAFVRAHRAP